MIAIERCRLHYKCTQKWEALERLPDKPRARFCGQCQSAVHLVLAESELDEMARQGKCVAVICKDSFKMLGMPIIPQEREFLAK